MMDYRTNTVLREDLMEMGRMFPDIAMPFVIGSSTVSSVFTCLKFVLSGVSANFTPLTGIRISRDVRLGSPSSLKPLVRLVSNIAGDETTGRELLTHLALHLLYLYNKVRAESVSLALGLDYQTHSQASQASLISLTFTFITVEIIHGTSYFDMETPTDRVAYVFRATSTPIFVFVFVNQL